MQLSRTGGPHDHIVLVKPAQDKVLFIEVFSVLHDGGEFYLRTIYIQQLVYTIEMLTKKQPFIFHFLTQIDWV